MGNDLASYRASIGLFNLRIKHHGNVYYTANVHSNAFICTHLILKLLRLLGSIGEHLKLVLCLMSTVVLLCSGDIELNPGPVTFGTRHLKLVQINIWSVRNKLDVLVSELGNYDIIVIGETKLDDSIDPSALSLNGFHDPPLRIDGPRNPGPSGGVLVYILNTLGVRFRNDLYHPNIQGVWANVICGQLKFLLGAIYRNPAERVKWWDDFCTVLDKINFEREELIIAGDLNSDMLADNPRSRHLKDIINIYGLDQVVRQPTRITPNTRTLLDVYITSRRSLISKCFTLVPICSDHCPVVAHIPFRSILKSKKAFRRRVWDYTSADYESLNDSFFCTNWEELLGGCQNVDDAFKKFLNEINAQTDRFVPNKEVTIRPRDKVWMNGHCRRLMRARNRAHRTAVRHNSPDLWAAFRRARNQVVTAVRAAKTEHKLKTEGLINDEIVGSRSWWRLAKKLLQKSTDDHIPPLALEQGGRFR